ncbi:MAG TPA: DNA-binding domain-containing protein, partial [Gammaproteobacteria bacterium]
MTQLAKLQQTFQECVLHPDKPVSAAWVSASGRAAPETQLSIYTYAYAARLTEVLANDYPAVLMAIGEDLFNELAHDYIQAYPSHHFSLRDFGRHLSEFIAEVLQ